MKNIDIFTALTEALDLEKSAIIDIFAHGEIDLSQEKIDQVLDTSSETDNFDNKMLESFLNGFIIYKRGKKEVKSGEDEKKPQVIKIAKHINNVVLKKLKIALSLTNDDMIDLYEEAGVLIMKSDLTPYFRKDNHKHYKRCDDQFLMNFIKGIKIYTCGA